ncbi:MAG: hypothetical protein IPM16_15590 [Chloroflexi bacterium]|nr:hypothetical protein [Chloroflexota bacterium]
MASKTARRSINITPEMGDMILRIIRVAEILVRVQFEIPAGNVDTSPSEHETDENRPKKHRSDVSM